MVTHRALKMLACLAAVLSVSACAGSAGSENAAGERTSQRAPASAVPESASSSQSPETVDLAGSIAYLSTVGFTGGSLSGLSFKAPRDGAPCGPEQGFNDIRPGGAVTITSGTNETLATVALGNAGTVALTRHSQPERDARAELIDAIYGLRIAKTWNAVEQARLYEAQAKQHLYDLRHPKRWGFEDAKFVAVWCRLPFTAANLPSDETYVVRVAERAPTVLTREDLDSQETLDLYLE